MNSPILPPIVRIFPLPDLVLFPHSLQMLYIFEPRYIQMVEDALAHDHTIAMALLKSGWEPDYDQAPEIHSTVCVGSIVSHAEKSNGHYTLLLSGVARARVVGEIENDREYRSARIEPILESSTDHGTSYGLRSLLCNKLRSLLASSHLADELMSELQGKEMDLGELVDLIAFTLPLDLDLKIALLSEPDVELRAQMLIDLMSQQGLPFLESHGQASNYSLN